MDQTPINDVCNTELLELIPSSSCRLIEVGCSSGALAREFKRKNPGCRYLGIDIEEKYVDLAKRHCDETLVCDIEQCSEDFYNGQADRDCWIFADSLEHLKDPWRVLKHIRRVIPQSGSLVVCIPNAQHWSLVLRLAIGNFRYDRIGLLDKTHLRWFTRQTMIELFLDAGFTAVEGIPRIFHEPNREKFLPLIGAIAKACNLDPNTVMRESTPYQYVFRAIPS